MNLQVQLIEGAMKIAIGLTAGYLIGQLISWVLR